MAALLEAHSDMYWDLLPLEKKLQEAWPAKLEAAKALTNGAAPSAAGLIKPSTSTSPSTAVASTSAASSSKKRGSVILDTVKNIYGTITKRPATGEVPKTKDTKEPPAALEGLGQVKYVRIIHSLSSLSMRMRMWRGSRLSIRYPLRLLRREFDRPPSSLFFFVILN